MFSRDDILEKPAKKDRNRLVFTIVPEYTDIYANPYSSGKVLAIFFHVRWGWREHCKMQKISSKDLPETPSLSASHLLWKSKNFPWICVKRFNRFHVKCRFSSLFFFLHRSFATTNDFWSNQESLDPLSYRCVCIG